MGNMILVGGIHGVGKSTFCNQIEEKYNLLSFSASKLISKKKNEQFKSKRIKGIDKNQDYLVEAINELSVSEEWYLLDGHFCLINNEGSITRIPEATFMSLSPKAIVLLTDSIETIVKRLNDRDNSRYDINFLKTFQENEREYSKEIASKLDIPHFEFSNNGDFKSLEVFIKQLMTN